MDGGLLWTSGHISIKRRGLKEFLRISRLGFLSRQLTNLLARADRGRFEAWVRPEDLSGVGPLLSRGPLGAISPPFEPVNLVVLRHLQAAL